MEELKADRDKRLAAEQKKAAEEKAAAEQAKKTKKIAMIAAPIVVVAIVAAVLISNFVKAQQEEAARLEAYNAAVALAEAGQYDEATAAFTELGDYKDSTEQKKEITKEITYSQAVTLFEEKQYEEAISKFEGLGDYKDSTEQAKNIADYVKAIGLMEDGDYEAASEIFSKLGDYEDSAEQLVQIDILKPYFPYIGEFICTVNGGERHLTSNFGIYDGNVCWEIDVPNNEAIGIRTNGVAYAFFTSCPVEDLIVSKEMTVIDEWYEETLTAKFENGDIFITGEGHFVSENDFYNRHYIKAT